MTEHSVKARELRVEHLDEPLGIDTLRPRLSWWLPEGAHAQVAYRLRAGEWDSGRVESAQSVRVPYAGPELTSGQRVEWSVKVWTDLGECEWADQAWWEMGLLRPTDWIAQWVEPAEQDDVRARVVHPSYHVRSGAPLRLDGSVRRARLYATARGIYEMFVNGRRVGDMELTPGFTSYESRLQVQTFDVTDLLKPDRNTVEAVLSDGWFRGQNGGPRVACVFGDRVALLVQLNVELEDGRVLRFGTGADWQSAVGPRLAVDLMEGETVDLRRSPSEWRPVVPRDFGYANLVTSPAPPVRRVEDVAVVAITRPGPDSHVVDFGQNINGWVRLTNLPPAGTTVRLTHGEALDGEGDVTVQNLANPLPTEWTKPPWNASNHLRPLQVDLVTSSGRPGEVFEPRHTTHGFRYVRVEGHPELRAEDVTGVVVHTDLRRTGWFECSDMRINKLHEAAVWSFRGNACDVPTDCPTRERAGWTGDWQIFVEVAAFLYDVAGFSAKWLRDLACDQRQNGAVTHIVPDAAPAFKRWFSAGSAGWGDAAVIVPWELYRAYGDTWLLEEQWSSMVAWVEYAARQAREHRHPSRVEARPESAPHEKYLWDTGFHYGEWLEPGGFKFNVQELAAQDNGDIATAYLHHSSRLLARVAKLVGRDGDAAHYEQLAANTKVAWQMEFVRPDGRLPRDTQAAYVRALAFDLLPEQLRPVAAARLVELIRKAGTHLGTGFLSTPYLLPVLADTGHLAVAYELLLQNSEPSWLVMIDRGATTIWESWDGADQHGVPNASLGVGSLNHYSKGAVISFLHRYMAGIQMLDDGPAYRRFRVAPQPGGGISWARAAHDSPYGRIESFWRIDGGELVLQVVVPPGTTAEVFLPDGQRFEALPGRTVARSKEAACV
jgi:alpha-L-rhamnosidase